MQTSVELAEKSLLGTMLKENYLIMDSGMTADLFLSQQHRSIFSAMTNLASNQRSVDYVTILTVKEPAEVGGANYLMDLNNFANSARFDEYREIVVGSWKGREKARLLQLAQMENWEIAEIQKAFDDLQEENSPQEETSIRPLLIAQEDRPFKPMERRTGVTTGLNDLDRMLDGFQDSEMTIVAARPSMGKTDTLNHFAISAGISGDLPIIFSLEMSKDNMLDRFIANAGTYNRLKMRDPHKYFSDKQKNNWMRTLGFLDETNLHIDDRSALKVSQIKARARQIIKAHPSKKPIIFIDYLQLIRPEVYTGNTNQEVGQISKALKEMAKEFSCPVVVLSQLSRAVEQRQDKRPIMSDLRDSGNIEQDADVIAFLYRDDYYDKESELTDMLEIIVSKHRNGPTGTVTVSYVKDTGKIYNINWSAGESTT